MAFLTTIDINVFSAIVLIIVYFLTNDHHMTHSKTRDSFKNLTLSVFVLIMLDLIWGAVEGKPGEFNFYLNNIVNFFRNGLSVLPAMLWVHYILHRIDHSSEKTNRYITLSNYLFAACLVLTVASPLFGTVYQISPNNVYTRGPFYFVLVIIPFFYMLTGAWLIIRNNDYFEKNKSFSLLSFVIFPLVGLGIQLLFFGVTLVWNFATVSIFIIYLRIQSKEQTTDYLTGLNTRAAFDNYIRMKVDGNESQEFFLIMIDIDKFKLINDKFGHKSGDESLMEFSEVLRRSVRTDDFVARYGGDEFVILLDCKEEYEIKEVLKRIKRETDSLNQVSKHHFKLDFSFGYAIYNETYMGNSDKFIDHVDQLMYQQKRTKD